MRKRQKEAEEAYEAMWNGGKGSHHPDFDPEAVGEDVVKASRETEVGRRVAGSGRGGGRLLQQLQGWKRQRAREASGPGMSRLPALLRGPAHGGLPRYRTPPLAGTPALPCCPWAPRCAGAVQRHCEERHQAGVQEDRGGR